MRDIFGQSTAYLESHSDRPAVLEVEGILFDVSVKELEPTKKGYTGIDGPKVPTEYLIWGFGTEYLAGSPWY